MSYFETRLNTLKGVLKYLDKGRKLEEIKHKAVAYTDLKSTLVYNFTIDVDLGDIVELDANLGTNILCMPLESANFFQEVIFQFCQSHSLLPAETTSTQICTRLKIITFPSDSCNLQISSVADLTKYIDYPGFVRLTGVVVGISGPAKYTQSTKYICPDQVCEGYNGNHYIRMHVPGASETQTIRNDFMCLFCGETLDEVKSLRTLSDKMVVEIAPIHLHGMSQRESFGTGRVQAVPVFVRDELIDTVQLGKAFDVIGICRKDICGEEITITLEANNIIQLQKQMPVHLIQLPDVVQKIYENCSPSPWSFPLNIAYRFGDAIASGGAMIKLRLLLLLSLVLSPQKHSLHILGIGRETGLVQSLMEYAQHFAVRSFSSSVATPLHGKVTTDKHVWAPYFVQCGSLLLSSGGVCYIGDIGLWKKTNRDQLQAALTGNKVFLDLASKHTGGLSQQLAFQLECQVWGIYDPESSGSKVVTQKEDVLGGCNTGDLNRGLLDAFSCPCFLDSGDSITEEEILIEMMNHTLDSWCEEESDGASVSGLNAEDIEIFLTAARQIEARISPQAENLIQNYYTASRTARSSGLNGSDVPSSALFTLTSFATGFAKLRLQPVVGESDALMAVYLYEESLVARYGGSVLNIQSQPHVPNSRLNEFLGKHNDIVMQQFHVQLLRFCSRAFDNQTFYREE